MQFFLSSHLSLSIAQNPFLLFLAETPVIWSERYLYGRGHVRLRSWCKEWNLPPLVLHGRGNGETRTNEEIGVYGGIILRSASRQKPAVNLPVAQLNCNLALRTQPVVAPNFLRLRRPANSSANQPVIASIRIKIVTVLVKTGDTTRKIRRYGGASFQPQIELRQSGQLWHVETRLVHGFPRVVEGRDFILTEGVPIERQPISQLGNAVGKIDSRAAVTEVVESIICASKEKHALQELMKRERDAFSRKYIGLRDAEFKVPRKVKTHLLSIEERLRIQRLSELPESVLTCWGVHAQELVARKLPREKVHPNVTENFENPRKPEWCAATDAKHRDRLRVIAEQKRAPFVRPPPETLFTERDLPIRKCHSDIGIEKTKAVDRCNWRCGRP